MKKILSLIALIGLAANCFATGPIPINSSQSGTVYFTTNGSAFILATNTFVPAFTYPPVVSVFLSSGPTNALPLTNIVTTTNFILSINTPTNCSVFWVANPASCLTQFGTVSTGGATNVTVTFPTPYAYAPVVVASASGNGTNGVASVSSVTITNFSIQTGASLTSQWISVGESANPGTQTVTH